MDIGMYTEEVYGAWHTEEWQACLSWMVHVYSWDIAHKLDQG